MAKKAVKKDAATPARSAKRVKATKAPKQETVTAPEKTVKPVEAVTAPAKTAKPAEVKAAKQETAAPAKTAKPVEGKAAKQETAAPAKTAKPAEVKAPKQETAAPAKTAKPAETKVEVYLQFGDREVRVDEVAKAAQEDFRGREEQSEMETVRLYLKPEDCAAYYVVNGAYNGKVAM